jgi:hypothetical protein
MIASIVHLHDLVPPPSLTSGTAPYRATSGMSGKSIEFSNQLTYRCRDLPTWR